jgi:hypothetical protein
MYGTGLGCINGADTQGSLDLKPARERSDRFQLTNHSTHLEIGRCAPVLTILFTLLIVFIGVDLRPVFYQFGQQVHINISSGKYHPYSPDTLR